MDYDYTSLLGLPAEAIIVIAICVTALEITKLIVNRVKK